MPALGESHNSHDKDQVQDFCAKPPEFYLEGRRGPRLAEPAGLCPNTAAYWQQLPLFQTSLPPPQPLLSISQSFSFSRRQAWAGSNLPLGLHLAVCLLCPPATSLWKWEREICLANTLWCLRLPPSTFWGPGRRAKVLQIRSLRGSGTMNFSAARRDQSQR